MKLNTLSPFIPQSDLILPSGYDNSMSYYEVLEKVITFLNDVISQTNTNTNNIEDFEKSVLDKLEGFSSEIILQVIEIIKQGDIFTDGSINPKKFSKEFLDSIYKIVCEQMSKMAKGVFYSLENGYFVIHVPDSWKEVHFGSENGHLKLWID